MLIGILVAGLWPFHSPKNQVSWLANGGGLWFGDYGAILSSGIFKMTGLPAEASCSLEIWLEPGLTFDTNTFLAFYTPNNPIPFSLHQSNRDLALESETESAQNHGRTARLYVDDIFRQGRSVFITVTSDAQETAVYVNGALVKKSREFTFSAKDFAGQLVVANSPVANDSWSGRLQGLAIYNRQLTAAQALQHYETWTANGRPGLTGNERPAALYLFDEHTGNIIRNHGSSGIDLAIPERYAVLHQTLLEPFWKEFRPDWGYLKDVLINIGGFIPLGFFFYAYFSSVRQIKRAAFLVIILGFATSLTIETLQAFLPTRDSGMTDVITNTLGTCCGVALYRCTSYVCKSLSRSRYAKVRQIAVSLACYLPTERSSSGMAQKFVE
ncbi:MAG TPA: VanZ family protein [Terriglobia bacterium]|nr:VanZ family protein [Terriglobia bacterium]